MADNIKAIPFSSNDEGISFPDKVRNAVSNATGVAFDETYVVSFTYVLGNVKALVSTSIPDGAYYEVTYNKNKCETYVDTYIKVANESFYGEL